MSTNKSSRSGDVTMTSQVVQRGNPSDGPSGGASGTCVVGGWCGVHGDVMRGFVVPSQGGLW